MFRTDIWYSTVLNANVSEVAEYEPFSMGKEKLDIDSSDHLYMTCTGM